MIMELRSRFFQCQKLPTLLPQNLGKKLIFSNLDSFCYPARSVSLYSLIYAKYPCKERKGCFSRLFTHLLPDQLFAQPGAEIHDFQLGRLENAILGEFDVGLPLVPLHGHVLQVSGEEMPFSFENATNETIFDQIIPLPRILRNFRRE